MAALNHTLCQQAGERNNELLPHHVDFSALLILLHLLFWSFALHFEKQISVPHFIPIGLKGSVLLLSSASTAGVLSSSALLSSY